MPSPRRHVLVLAVAVLSSAAGCRDFSAGGADIPAHFEVWSLTRASVEQPVEALHIVSSATNAETTAGRSTIDLAQEVSALCRSRTGLAPSQAQDISFTADYVYAAVDFTSGHVAFFDTATRTLRACVRPSVSASGVAGDIRLAPDGSYLIVVDAEGKQLRRTAATLAKMMFADDAAASLELSTCRTRTGAACEAADVRPDTTPICAAVTRGSDLLFVALRGGGLFVIDPRETPMRVVAEYDMHTVRIHGCDVAEAHGSMYFGGYRFAVDPYRTTGGFLPNSPFPGKPAEPRHHQPGLSISVDGAFYWRSRPDTGVIDILAVHDGAQVATVSSAYPSGARAINVRGVN